MIEEFHDLYEHAVSIDQLKPQASEEYLVFKEKKGRKVKLFSVKRHLEHLPHYESFYQFFQENEVAWLVPCALPSGQVVGYLLRGMGKKAYRVFIEKGRPQLLFGWEDFQIFKKGKPIVIVEGVKDCLYLKRFYPFVLACLTSRLAEEMLKVVGELTDKVVLAVDNDEEGQRATKWMKEKFLQNKVRVVVCSPLKKDWAEYVRTPGMEVLAQGQLRTALLTLGESL